MKGLPKKGYGDEGDTDDVYAGDDADSQSPVCDYGREKTCRI